MFAEKIVYKSVCILLHIRCVGKAMVRMVYGEQEQNNVCCSSM